MNTDNFVQGMTAAQDFQLLVQDVNGNTTPFDATGGGGTIAVYTVTLVLVSHATGTPVDTAANVAWVTPALGKVRYSPDAGDLVAAGSPYDARWKVVDAGGLITYFPDGIPDRWVVRL